MDEIKTTYLFYLDVQNEKKKFYHTSFVYAGQNYELGKKEAVKNYFYYQDNGDNLTTSIIVVKFVEENGNLHRIAMPKVSITRDNSKNRIIYRDIAFQFPDID